MNNTFKFIFLSTFIFVIVGSLNIPSLTSIRDNLDFQEILNSLGGILFIGILVERTTNIIIRFWRHNPTRRIKKNLKYKLDNSILEELDDNEIKEYFTCTLKIEKYYAEIEKYYADIEKYYADIEKYNANIEKYNAEIEKYYAEIEKYNAETKNLSLLISFSLSILLCSTGVGLLGEILYIKEIYLHLRLIDLIFTSSLITGISDSFHQFVQALEIFFTQLNKNMR